MDAVKIESPKITPSGGQRSQNAVAALMVAVIIDVERVMILMDGDRECGSVRICRVHDSLRAGWRV